MKDVPGYEGRYKADTAGNIYSFRWGKPRRLQPILNNRYLKVNLYDEEMTHKQRSVHRIVALTFLPPVEGKLHVNHIDGNRLNNSLDNLEWCTPQENVEHSVKTGLHRVAQGSDCGNAKLTEENVREIKELLKTGLSQSKIGRLFNISQPIICEINTGKIWRYV